MPPRAVRLCRGEDPSRARSTKSASGVPSWEPSPGRLTTLRTQLSRAPGGASPGASALTAAGLRLLPLLSTHLPFPEIAREMFLSPNTIKSQASSIYRKLGASSRGQSVTHHANLV
jgi:LuxR family maltose regulon positive regulatory protein